MTRKKDEPESYEVGFKKPPRENQFKPGQSGNPRGRPRGAKSTRTLFMETGNEKVKIIENGTPKNIPRREVMIRRLYDEAMRGNFRMIHTILQAEERFGLYSEEEINTRYLPTEADIKLIQQLGQKLGTASSKPRRIRRIRRNRPDRTS
jgi:hypothetical protein